MTTWILCWKVYMLALVCMCSKHLSNVILEKIILSDFYDIFLCSCLQCAFAITR